MTDAFSSTVTGEAWGGRRREAFTLHSAQGFPSEASPAFVRRFRTGLSSVGGMKCRNCGKTFTFYHNMVRHRLKCEGVFHLQCPHCGRGFYRRDKLTIHIARYHAQEQDQETG
ncbi:hypothetical protein BaRGS_00027461 [Batillaria attramentaria]|uniref:C2H2-type domain-containing protein n=1 Tax=Batillaria attramentaria TaxID=370345 RepID=A0ABD0K2T8_9CAEN